MNAQEAEAAYRIVKGQLDARQITVDDYNRRVAELRYQDNTGTWWSISPQDGSWLKWNGATWAPAFAHATPAAAPSPAAQPAQQQAQPAAQPTAQPAAAHPSWYIPPVGAQQKPATQPATAQPVQLPVYQQPVEQPTAAPSYYIPPSRAAQQPVVQQPAPDVAVKPARNWLAIVSFIVSLVSWLIYPIIIGFIAIVLGVLSLYRAKKNQSKIPVSAVIAIIIGLLAIVINFFWLEIFPAPAVLPPIK